MKSVEPMTLLKAMGGIPDEYIESALPGDRKKESGKVISFFRRREILVLAAAAVLMILAFSLAPGLFGPRGDQGQDLAVNPYTACRSLEEAEEAAGLTLNVPESFRNSSSRIYAVIDGKIIDVSYLDAGENRIMSIRKGRGEDDISGDYREYLQEDVIDMDGISVTVKGENDLICLALWQEGGCSYAASFDEGAAMDELTEIIKTVMD